jgi:hypothetical protein
MRENGGVIVKVITVVIRLKSGLVKTAYPIKGGVKYSNI